MRATNSNDSIHHFHRDGVLVCSLTIAGWEYLDRSNTATDTEKPQEVHISISDAIIQGNVVGNVSGANAEVQYTSSALASMAAPAPTLSVEEREGIIRSAITEQIEVLRSVPGGPIVLYGDLTRQVPETFPTEEIVRVIEQMRLDRIVDFDGPFAPHSTVIRLLPQWSSVQNLELRRLLVEPEQALALHDPVTALAGAKVAFERIVWAIRAEYEDVTRGTSTGSFQSFLFAVDKLGLSLKDARKCREITTSFTFIMSEGGHWQVNLRSAKTNENYTDETTFVLGFLAQIIPSAQNIYPDAMQRITIGVPFTEQRLWKERHKG